jgi:hypothetical protein
MLKLGFRALRLLLGVSLILPAVLGLGAVLLFSIGQLIIPAAPVAALGGVIGIDLAGSLGITLLLFVISMALLWLGLRILPRGKPMPSTPAAQADKPEQSA